MKLAEALVLRADLQKKTRESKKTSSQFST